MKKIISAIVCLLLLCSLTLPVLAADVPVTFTGNSLPQVGKTLTVDKGAMLENGNITAEMYNALLEGYVIYSWYKNDKVALEGSSAKSYKMTAEDQGSTIYVKVSFFEDDSFQEAKKCGEAVSDKLKVTAAKSDKKEETVPATTAPTTPETTAVTVPATTADTTPATTPETQPQAQTPDTPVDIAGFPWWGYLLIALGGIVTGIGIAYIFTKQKKTS